MQKEMIHKPEIKLVGLSIRTNLKNEMDPSKAKIGKTAARFWSENVASKIPNRKNNGITLSVYTEYETNEYGDYTYFIGEEVTSLEDKNIPEGMVSLTIPSAQYQKFTTPIGKMPEVVIKAWQQIWQMTENDFGGQRAYHADFEVYDERAHDPLHTSLDIYIGIK